jgi:hypothetical protein
MTSKEYKCAKCENFFSREIDLIRHNARKIPCNRNLKCERCFKEFTQISHLKNHNNRKFLCDNKKEELLLTLEIKKEETKIKDKELSIEQEKTKQEDLKLKKARLEKSSITNNNCDIQNIFGDQINNIINIDQIELIKTLCQYDAEQLISRDNVEETLKRMVAHQFNNDKHPNNKCLKIHEGQLYSKINNAVVEFKKTRFVFNNIIKLLHNHIDYDYGPYSKCEMYKYGVSQRSEHIDKKDILTTNRVNQYVGNPRNNLSVDTVTKTAVK